MPLEMSTTDIIAMAQIGCGYWGPNLLRNFTAQRGCSVKWVVEQSAARRSYVESNFPRTRTTTSVDEVLQDPEVSAVVVATPASTHFELARSALRSGKHVFVEKPLAMNTREADELVALARTSSRVLMAGHTFLYNAAVHHAKKLLDAGELGRLFYVYSQRLNLGQVRADVNAWWNLAPHDVSILLYLMDGALPTVVTAQGYDYIQPGIEDVVFATLVWPSGIGAHVHVSWLDPGKVRKMTLVGSRKMVVYDDVGEDKITVLDKGVDRVPRIGERMDFDQSGFDIVHRAGDILLPRVEFTEPLKVESAHFLDCVRRGATPVSGPAHARDVVAILEAGQQSIKQQGRPVHLAPKER